MPLCEHRAEPCRERAPAVKVAKERLSLAALLCHPVQIGVQGISQLAGVSGRIDGISRSIENGTKREDEMLPRRVVSRRAPARERQIFDVKRFEILAQVKRGRRLA